MSTTRLIRSAEIFVRVAAVSKATRVCVCRRAMTRITIARICCCCCLLLLLIYRSALAAPLVESYPRGANNYAGRQRAPRRDYYGETSPFGYLASKAMGAFVRVASFMFQWMPSFWRPAKSSFRFLKSNNDPRPMRYEEYDFFDADAYR
ncbi:uncharacterized protein LOC116416755 [Nasonia vitripennis]|uniref:Uncharacterized protein n=1 Tax=Nasonia vitripennis TaxID=7425 RepID=A0A7M7Q9U0_NASVI|nr:uncharacterized protein LOC116416755 [Nasonia vitripennis]